MRILVIGGTSFIGARVVRRLARDGHAVTVFHRGTTEVSLFTSLCYVEVVPLFSFPISDSMKALSRWMSVPVLSLFLLAGCATHRPAATAQYKRVQDKMSYRAKSINLGTMFPTGGLSQDPSVSLRSWATCSGKNCQPQRVWFSFLLRSRNPSRVLSSRDVEIRTDGNVRSWPEGRQRFAGEVKSSGQALRLPGSNSGTELVRISMKVSTLQDIAQSKRMSGTLGTQEFSLSYKNRQPLRALLKKIRNPSGKPKS